MPKKAVQVADAEEKMNATPAWYTPKHEIAGIVARARAQTSVAADMQTRRNNLTQCLKLLTDNTPRICAYNSPLNQLRVVATSDKNRVCVCLCVCVCVCVCVCERERECVC